MAIEIGSIGYNHVHEKGFVSDFPGGPGAYLFLLVKSNSIFTIGGQSPTITNGGQTPGKGETHILRPSMESPLPADFASAKLHNRGQTPKFSVNKNSYIILNPHTPCSYKGAKVNYIDDWFYFWVDDEEKQKLIENGIEFDKPVYIGKVDELSALIHRISFEHFSNDNFHNELKEHYTRIFFYQLARIVTSKEQVSPDFLSTKNNRLTYLRTRLFQDPTYFSNVDEMADFVNLSRSGFQHMYNKVFGHSVMQDIVAGRVEMAKNYLKTTNETISEIASKCGYKSDYHFMRQFKEQTGKTPTEYRNSDTWNQIEESRG